MVDKKNMIYENALRDVVPGVTLPYWATSLDSELPESDQARSAIWSEPFLGNGDGFVTKGPFANWNTPSGPLLRNVGLFGDLLSNDMIQNVLSQQRTFQITSPNAVDKNNIERLYDSAQIWIGGGSGQMNDFNTAAQDPVFYNLHVFIDYIWEKFRKKQIEFDIEPSQDYPREFVESIQSPNEPMRFGNLLNIDGYSNYFTANIYTYESIPTCSNQNRTCLSDFLHCDTSRTLPRCVALMNDEVLAKNSTKRKSGSCKNDRRGIQNNYLIGNEADIRQWVYLPVDIVYRRPPNMKVYPSFPVFGAQGMTISDIYSPSSYIGLASTIPIGNPAVYKRCMNQSENYGQVFLESTGLNYFGTYKEFSIVDNRLAFSHYTGYVAVRSPEYGTSNVLLSAHDACGRMCKPYCKEAKEGLDRFVPCSGAVSISNKAPNQYSQTYGKNILDTWEFPVDGACPEPKKVDPYVKFFCDFSDRWPWNPIQLSTARQNDLTVQTSKLSNPQRRKPVAKQRSVTEKPFLRPLNASMNANASSIEFNKTIAKQGCLLGYGCVVGIKCGPCKPGMKLPCIDSTTLFAMCTGEVFMIRKCLKNTYFDIQTGTCRKNTSKIT